MKLEKNDFNFTINFIELQSTSADPSKSLFFGCAIVPDISSSLNVKSIAL